MTDTAAPLEATTPWTEVFTAAEWFGVITADPDGILGPCCAEVSETRDALLTALLSGDPLSMIGAARAVETLLAGHDMDDDRWQTLLDTLTAHLDECRPDWRDWTEPSDVELTAFMLAASLGDSSADTVDGDQPTSGWIDAFTAAAEHLDTPGDDLEGWWDDTRRLLNDTRVAGCPALVVAGLYETARDRLRSAHRNS